MARQITFSQLSGRLRAIGGEVKKEVGDILEFNAGEIEREAIAAAPGGSSSIAMRKGSLKYSDITSKKGWTPISQAIGYVVTNERMKVTIYVEKSAGDVAAWVEFGTGQSAKSYLVTVPAEWRAIARRYYVNGRGRIIAAPYLLPAYMKYKDNARQEIKNYIKSLSL